MSAPELFQQRCLQITEVLFAETVKNFRDRKPLLFGDHPIHLHHIHPPFVPEHFRHRAFSAAHKPDEDNVFFRFLIHECLFSTSHQRYGSAILQAIFADLPSLVL